MFFSSSTAKYFKKDGSFMDFSKHEFDGHFVFFKFLQSHSGVLVFRFEKLGVVIERVFECS